MKISYKNKIRIIGANENNLKNVSLTIPKNKLIVFTGVSGSGKSSLAFNTIYEEGKRKYVDSLSSYARQFLGGTKKPLVDSIEGLMPSISIEQKTTHNNPRSTVGTVTDIYDYLRLLYARLGKAFCPKHKIPISSQTRSDIINDVFNVANNFGDRIHILAPIVEGKKGSHEKIFNSLRDHGFIRFKVDGEIITIDGTIPKLDKNFQHTIELVIDRLILKKEDYKRVVEDLEMAFQYGQDRIIIENITKNELKKYSKMNACPYGDFHMPIFEPRLFSFNSPFGMCNECKGLGVKLKADPAKIVVNDNLTINKGAILYYKNFINTSNLEWQEMEKLLKHYNISKNVPFNSLSKKAKAIILYGSDEELEYVLISSSGNKYERKQLIEGVATKIERKNVSSNSEMLRTWYRKNFMSDIKCVVCQGTRINKHALAVKILNKNISEFTKLSIDEALIFILKFEAQLKKNDSKIANLIINELYHRLTFLENVGLEYLTLDRKAETLSGGESQRIRLATQVGSGLTGVLYVLDEPSIGLHASDNQKLIKTLKQMVSIGNTLIVVEHDEEMIKSSDWIVDIGPLAGTNGGQIIGEGKLDDICNNPNSVTGNFLTNQEKIPIPKKRWSGNGQVLEIGKINENNLKNITVKIPLGKMIVVTGVSGSGKSTLVNEVIVKAVMQKTINPFIKPGKFGTIKGFQHINRVVNISQDPIGKTPRSNPATYTSVFDDIRDLFAMTLLAKARNYKKGRFSFNVEGGRCEKCHGDGSIKIAMHFLPDVFIDCDTCDGKRYNLETLDVKYKNKDISDVLSMEVDKALDFFNTHPKISWKLQVLKDVGLGYIKLGQSSISLSGGEAQRIKLATHLQKVSNKKHVLYVLDEPTTGLHPYDVKKLMRVLFKLREKGNTILIIEHNLDVIKLADYIIDLGPHGGKNGGQIVAEGTPKQILKTNTLTSIFLKKIFEKEKGIKNDN